MRRAWLLLVVLGCGGGDDPKGRDTGPSATGGPAPTLPTGDPLAWTLDCAALPDPQVWGSVEDAQRALDALLGDVGQVWTGVSALIFTERVDPTCPEGEVDEGGGSLTAAGCVDSAGLRWSGTVAFTQSEGQVDATFTDFLVESTGGGGDTVRLFLNGTFRTTLAADGGAVEEALVSDFQGTGRYRALFPEQWVGARRREIRFQSGVDGSFVVEDAAARVVEAGGGGSASFCLSAEGSALPDCPVEPRGSLELRGAGVVEVTFDGAGCDGCGPATLDGEDFGPLCLE